MRWIYTVLIFLFSFLIHTRILASFVNWFFCTNFLRIVISIMLSLFWFHGLYLCHFMRNRFFLFFFLDETQLLFTFHVLSILPAMLLRISFISWLRSLFILWSPLLLSLTSFWKGDIAGLTKAINPHFLLCVRDCNTRFAKRILSNPVSVNFDASIVCWIFNNIFLLQYN